MKKLLPFLMIAFITVSCSNEIEESYLQNDSLKEQNSDIAVTNKKKRLQGLQKFPK